MEVSNVAKMQPLDRFVYWIRERHEVYMRRQKGLPKPWTDDEVLQSVFFTNPYRENDKTTVWFRDNVRNPMQHDPRVLDATVIFRWFNKIETGELLLARNLLQRWDQKVANTLLMKAAKAGPVFTGAYMIKAGNGPPGCKVPNVCKSISAVLKDSERLVQVCRDDCRLEALWKELKEFPNLGPFMAYEIVCDLRYTDLLRNATDVETWCNIGPGARRGLARLQGTTRYNERGKMVPLSDKGDIERVRQLMLTARKRLPGMTFEMRDIEHSLCEFDKYERARLNDGRIKRLYRGI